VLFVTKIEESVKDSGGKDGKGVSVFLKKGILFVLKNVIL
jgi:hypothetical protein